MAIKALKWPYWRSFRVTLESTFTMLCHTHAHSNTHTCTHKHTKTYKCMHKRTLKSEHTAKNWTELDWTDDAGGDLTNAHSDLAGEGTLLPLMVKETFPLCLVRKKRKEEFM